VVIVGLISGGLMGFGLYRSFQLSAVNGAWWLTRGLNWTPRGTVDVVNALKQGVWGTFFNGTCDYNGAFWTMHYELLGSIAVYALAMFVIIASKKLDWRIILVGLIALWIREAIRFPFLGSFVLGSVLALIYTNARELVWKNRTTLILGGILSVIIGGFTIPENDLPQSLYIFLRADSVDGRLCVVYFLYSLIALFFLSVALWAPAIRDFLSRPLLRKLGHLSFPIYLIHTPIMCSIGAWLYLALYHHSTPLAIIAACVVSLILTTLLAIPLAAFDDRWLLIVRRITPIKSLWQLYSGKATAPGQTATFRNN
jgi:peptidoglycan/LPS O-acetylase OafA/YrhL